MVNNFLGNPHKTEYEDIDEDFNVLAEEFVDGQDSSDYEDENDDHYEEEEEEDDNDEEDEDDDYYEEEEEEDDYDEDDYDEDEDDDDGVDYWGISLSNMDSTLDTDVPGPPDSNRIINEADLEEVQKDEPAISIDKESTESKGLDEMSIVHRNIENNSET